MTKLTPPSSPPQAIDTLLELQDYYQELISYHSAALENSKRLLSHTEVLLSAMGELETPLRELEDTPVPSPALPPLQEPYRKMNEYEAIQKVLSDSRGEVVRIDYITYELYGHLEPEKRTLVQQQLEELLQEGVKQGNWEQYRESPHCYTLNLEELENQFPRSLDYEGRPPSLPDTVFVKEKYQRITFQETIASVLEATQKVMTIGDVEQELYENITPEAKEKTRQVTAGGLARACESHLIKRVRVGHYSAR